MTAKLVAGEVDLSTWGFTDTIAKDFAKDYGHEISEAITDELKDSPPRITLPWMWGPEGDGYTGSTGVTDPATLYMALPLGGSDCDEVVFGVSLEEAVDDYIEAVTNGRPDTGDKICEPQEIERAKALSARLRELADKVDAACASEAEQQAFAQRQRQWLEGKQ